MTKPLTKVIRRKGSAGKAIPVELITFIAGALDFFNTQSHAEKVSIRVIIVKKNVRKSEPTIPSLLVAITIMKHKYETATVISKARIARMYRIVSSRCLFKNSLFCNKLLGFLLRV